MYDSDELEIWNLTPEGEAYAGAQAIFNVVGRLKGPRKCREFWYSLNDGEKRRVFLGDSPRMSRAGDFNIDTIDLTELTDSNRLEFWLHYDGEVARHTLPFRARRAQAAEPRFELQLEDVSHAEEVGQVIDGRWLVSEDELGERCLEIRPEDAGYDRLFAIGGHNWRDNYRVRVRLRVTRWTRRNYFNLGLLFKWNPHLGGGGEALPRQWTGGLAYYAAKCAGLRLRFGVKMRYSPFGKREGSHVLAEKPYHPLRRWVGFVRNDLLRIGQSPIAQLKPGAYYVFDLLVDRGVYALRVHEEGSARRPVELRVPNPPELLREGCLGLIACDCAVRIYEYTVTPAQSPPIAELPSGGERG